MAFERTGGVRDVLLERYVRVLSIVLVMRFAYIGWRGCGVLARGLWGEREL